MSVPCPISLACIALVATFQNGGLAQLCGNLDHQHHPEEPSFPVYHGLPGDDSICQSMPGLVGNFINLL